MVFPKVREGIEHPKKLQKKFDINTCSDALSYFGRKLDQEDPSTQPLTAHCGLYRLLITEKPFEGASFLKTNKIILIEQPIIWTNGAGCSALGRHRYDKHSSTKLLYDLISTVNLV